VVPRDEVVPDNPKQRQIKSLVGRVGYAKSQMLPSGAVVIDGRTIDAMSEGVPIDVGQKGRVIDVRANRVVVRVVDDDTPTADAKDPLQRPIDSIGPDPFGAGKNVTRIQLQFSEGDAKVRFWTSDLTAEYVRLNADYHT